MSISNLLTSGAQAGADLSITCHNVICDAESVFEAGLKTNAIAEYGAGAGVSIDGVLLKDGQVEGSLPYFEALKATGSIATTTNALISAYDSVSGSLAGQFSLATGFTPTVSGIYLITGIFTCNAGATSAGAIMEVSIYQNSLTNIQIQDNGYVGGPISPTVSGLIKLTAGTLVNMEIYQTLASPLAITNLRLRAVLLARV